mmetsp:Transcript_8890/g.28218  ORF Transcript_8890/g.28218 Transcript_8890/m.28218 type:complete len:213 (-) Transcript_8890:60-698(-)
MLFSWADCAAPFGCLNVNGYEGEDQPTGLPVVTRDSSDALTAETLLESAETGDLETVKRIISSGAVDIDAVDEVDSYSALMMSAEAGHLDIVKALKEAGAQIEIRDSYGRTPLYAAAVAGHIDVVSYLVRVAGADVAALDCENRSVLWACCAVRRVDIAAVLLESEKCNLNSVAGSGETAIDFAVKHGHAEVAEFLRGQGAIDTNRGRLSVH